MRAPTTSSNRRAATRDAARLLRLATLPPGAIRLAAEPRGDDKLLPKPTPGPTGPSVDRYGWWLIPATFDSVIAFLQAHPPRGSTPSGSGGAIGHGYPQNQMRTFSFPWISGVVATRTLTLSVAALRGGGTGILVDAEETWIVTRPAGERVPAGVHEVGVTSARPGEAPILTRTVTSPAKVRRIISLIDAMQVLQPGFYGCPALPVGAPVVTFDFRAAAGTPVLATASLTDYDFPSGPCNAVSFNIGGRPQKPLVGGNFLSQVQRLLGVQFQ